MFKENLGKSFDKLLYLLISLAFYPNSYCFSILLDY